MNKISNKIIISTKQKTNLSPQSKLFIKLISLNNTKLDKLISDELDDNPCIEEIMISTKSKFDNSINYNDPNFQIENDPLTLKDYLMEQLRTLNMKAKDKKIVQLIIFSLNDSGQIDQSNEEILDLVNKNLSKKYTKIQIEEIIKKCQESFDPPGIFTRSLAECLKVQMRFKNLEDIDLKNKIISNDIELLGNKDFQELAIKYGVSKKFLNIFFDEIKDLNPKPGDLLSNEKASPGPSDYEAYVYFEEDKLVYQPNKAYKEIKISDYYEKLITNKSSLSKEVSEFIGLKIDHASLLIKTIRERNDMYEKAIKLICEIQSNFIKKGEKYLKPLKLSDISSELNVHESTVSRITSNKYILCERGIINLKEFFSNKVDSDSDTSSVSIRSLIEEMVKSEDKKNPLSDESIREKLAIKNINIARRTIAKYRNVLKIPSSSRRRA